VSPHHPTRDLGERCKLPQRGMGQNPDRKWILCIFQVRNKPSTTPFSVFLSDGRANQMSRGPGKLSTLPPSRWSCQNLQGICEQNVHSTANLLPESLSLSAIVHYCLWRLTDKGVEYQHNVLMLISDVCLRSLWIIIKLTKTTTMFYLLPSLNYLTSETPR